MRPWQLGLAIVLVPGTALALKPAEHRVLLEQACAAERLPDAFCRRAGKAVFETDYNEWDDLSAHAQTPRGGDRCSAADASIARAYALGQTAVAEAYAQTFEQAAIDLGRAIHTLQDECAHHGMTNEEHAFYSLDQTCTGDQVSPDVQPAAIACATARTQRAMHAAALALAAVPWGDGVDQLCQSNDPDRGSQDTCAQAALPTPVQACEFLALYKDWTGIDSTWAGDVVGGALESAFASGVAGGAAPGALCNGDPGAIDPPAPRPTVVVGDQTCTLTNVSCFGKVDDGHAPDPYGDAPPASAGCAASGGAGWALLALVMLPTCRRSRASRARARAGARSPSPSR